MAIKFLSQKYFYGGIAASEKIGIRGSFAFAKRLNIFDEATQVSIMPKTVKVSGNSGPTQVTDLIKWIVPGTPYDTNIYFYSEGGIIYRETSAGVWSALQTTANSYGQGMEVHGDYIYYTQNTQLGRYGTLSGGSPTFDDNWDPGTGVIALNDTSTTKYAPLKAFKEGLAVGHGNYLGWWDGAVWDADRLVLPPGLQIRCLEVLDEFLVIGTWRGTTINSNEEGYLFFWDGTSTTFNYFVAIPQGGCGAILNNKNRLLSSVGGSGDLLLGYNPFQKIETIPKLSIDKYAEILPGAVTNWRGMAQLGIAGNTTSTDVIQGVYTYGHSSDNFPEVLNYSFTISTGTETGVNLKIGALKGIGNSMYIAWRDGDTYGVDKVTNNNAPFATGVMEGLIFDNEQLYKDKEAMKLKATHLPLAADETIQLGYKKNRASSYTTDTANAVDDTTETTYPMPADDARFREFQQEVILGAGGSTSPTVTSIGMQMNDLADEEDY
jgi:hypothetical protein